MSPRRAIHPLLRTTQIVLRNGASIRVETVAATSKPHMLSVVRGGFFHWFVSLIGVFFFLSTSSCFLRLSASFSTTTTPPPPPTIETKIQDPTVHPRWTGDASAVASEDGRLAKFARKFEGALGGAGGGVGGVGGGRKGSGGGGK